MRSNGQYNAWVTWVGVEIGIRIGERVIGLLKVSGSCKRSTKRCMGGWMTCVEIGIGDRVGEKVMG